jgi:hypothetical protein
MWIRLSYAVASGVLGILAAAAAFFAWALNGRCGPEIAFADVALVAVLVFPVTIAIGAGAGIVGFNGRRKAVAALAILFALALGAVGIVQAVPHRDDPYQIQCRIDL